MGGGDNGCGSWLLGATSNKTVAFPRQDSIRPLDLMLIQFDASSLEVYIYSGLYILKFMSEL